VSKYSSKDCIFVVDGYNILGVLTDVGHSVEAVLEEDTALGDTWATFDALGINKADLTQEGFFDDDADSVNAALNEQQGVSRIVCLGFEGNTIGKHFTGYQGAMQVDYNRLASIAKLHRCNARYQGSGKAEDGRILHALTARTADGDTELTPVDNTVDTDYGGAVYLQLTALTLGGYTDLTVKVRHSADNVTYDDLTTFTALVTAPGKERKTIAAGVDSMKRYLAVSWAFTGTGADPSATFFVGAARNAS
jgi:hypothetical protein